MAEQNYKGRETTLTHDFCSVFVTVFIGLIAYMFISLVNFSNSQNNIVNKQMQHIEKVDSLFSAMEKVVLSNDSTTIVNSKALLSQLQRDSALFKQEILLAQQETNSLANLHIEKIDNDYAQIGIWGGILSVIFLVFGFFGIFKIEENKREAEKMVAEVKKEAETVIADIQGKATSLNHIIDNLTQQTETFYAQKEQDFKEFLQNRENQFDQSIRPLLEEVERKKAELEKMLNNKNRNGGQHE